MWHAAPQAAFLVSALQCKLRKLSTDGPGDPLRAACGAWCADAHLAALLLLQDSLRPSLLDRWTMTQSTGRQAWHKTPPLQAMGLLMNLGEIQGLPLMLAVLLLMGVVLCSGRRQTCSASQTCGLLVGSSAGCAASRILRQQSSSTSLQLSRPGTTLACASPIALTNGFPLTVGHALERI